MGADKAFCVLLKAMESENKAGLAKTVLGTKETLILLRAKNGAMIINTMFFSSEVQKMPQASKAKISEKELELAKTLINQMSGKFEPEKYKDEYHKKLLKAIKAKIAGKEIIEAKESKQPAKVINLMEALKKSLKTEKVSKRKAE